MASKRHRENLGLVDRDKLYELGEAVDVLKSARSVKFDESVEISVGLGIDAKKSDQNVRGAVVLPHGTGRSVRVIVFAEGSLADEATEAGAVEVGAEDLAKKIEGGWFEFDVAIAHPLCMKFVGKLGKVLGPKGLMPSPKAGTVTPDVAAAVKEYQAGKVEFRSDDGGNVRVGIGKLSFDVGEIVENANSFMKYLAKLRPGAAKGTFIHRISLASTMGPGLHISTAGEWS